MFIRWPWSLKLGWTHFYWLWHCCQNLVRPSFAMNPSNFGLVSTFVKMLDRFSAVGMYVTKIFPSSTASQMKWYRRSICLVWEWYLLSFASAITPWLSQLIFIASTFAPQISSTKLRSHSTSFTTCVCAMYSASVLDNTMICCFFELQDIAPDPKWNKYPDMECLCFWLTQSVLQYPSMLGDALHRPMSPLIFLRHLCIFLLIVASPRRSALAAPILESDDHVT